MVEPNAYKPPPFVARLEETSILLPASIIKEESDAKYIPPPSFALFSPNVNNVVDVVEDEDVIFIVLPLITAKPPPLGAFDNSNLLFPIILQVPEQAIAPPFPFSVLELVTTISCRLTVAPLSTLILPPLPFTV